MDNSGAVFVTCPKGHKSAVIYSHHKYEVLFTSGTAALEDGYANEAVSTMNAALERAYEFFFRVIFRKHGIADDQIDAAWKSLSRQSERQLGAFCALWMLETKQPFALPKAVPEFRNKIIHSGYIPQISEVRDFAAQIFDLLKLIVSHLQTAAADAMEKEFRRNIGIQYQAIPKGMPQCSMSRIGITDASIVTFDDWLEKIHEMRSLEESYHVQANT
jgi:hypothetical protein